MGSSSSLRTARVNYSFCFPHELSRPCFRRLIALGVARGAKHPRYRLVTLLSVEQSLQLFGQQLPASLADTGIADTLRRRSAVPTAELNWILAFPSRQRRFLLTGRRVSPGRSHVTHIENRFTGVACARTVSTFGGF